MILRISLLLAILVMSRPTSGSGQETTDRSSRARVPVTVAIVSAWSYGDTPSMIVRRADASPHDVILLRDEGADGRSLSAAVRDLLVIRERMGDTAKIAAAMRVRPSDASRGRARATLPWAQRVVDDAYRAEVRTIAGIGQVRAVQIWLPAQQKRIQ